MRKTKQSQMKRKKSGSRSKDTKRMVTTDRKSNGHGWSYETQLCVLIFIRAYMRKLKTFQLRYQVPEAGKADDVVYYDGQGHYHLVQLKHKEKKASKITHADLFHIKYKGDFNLIKYVKSVIDTNTNAEFKDKHKTAIVFTNSKLKLKELNKLRLYRNSPTSTKWYEKLESTLESKLEEIEVTPTILDQNDILHFPNEAAKYYKFSDDENIVSLLKIQAEDTETNHRKKIGDIEEEGIRDALENIIYAVEQPDFVQLKKIIKEEIKKNFKVYDAEPIYEKLEVLFRYWCETKNPLGQPSMSIQSNVPKHHVLTYDDADEFFQKHVKVVSFGVTAPTDAFVGRVKESEQIKEQLNKSHNLIVSQTVTISGLGGIGKTQLAKQFIKQFGHSEFYGRIVWIEADSDETVKNSFEQLAQVLNIRDFYHKNIKALIYEIFEYFAGFKVLFVFDNYDTSPAYKGSLVTYCWKTSSGPTNSGRPYFLLTSRNRKCLPGVPLLDLNVLSLKEAVVLIKKELTELNPTEADAEKLANVLQCFPLALRQAVAYIKQQHTRKQLFGDRYKMQDYFTKFDKETQNLLEFKFPDDFGESEKTTFITWNVTLDAIKADEAVGRNAIQVLKVIAYLHPDKISPEIILTFFYNDDEKTADALLLLEKYSMVTKLEQEQSTFYQIHRLVQAVVQLKFQDKRGAIMKQAFILINPELSKMHKNFDKEDYSENVKMKDLMHKCSADQLLHYSYLSASMKKLDQLKIKVKIKYESFFDNLNDRVLYRAAVDDDDVQKIKALEIPADDLKKFLEENIDYLLKNNCNKVIKYLIESGQLGKNQQIKDTSLIKCSTKVMYANVEVFKYLIEQGADFSEVLECASLELICEVKTGKSDLLQNFINKINDESDTSSIDTESDSIYNNKSDFNQNILNECLFFATIFNQESIVRILLENIVEPNFKYKKWSLIEVAAIFDYKTILEILLTRNRTMAVSYDGRRHLKECLENLLKDRYFSDKEAFEMIYNKYFRDLHDNYELWFKLCYNFKICKLDLAYFLLDEGADDALLSYGDSRAMASLLFRYENDVLSVDDKHCFDELFKRIIFHNLTPDKFINIAVHHSFNSFIQWLPNEYYRNLFEKMLREFGDINVRNTKGETLLIKYLQKYKPDIEIVKYLIEQGIDIEVQANGGKSALYYAVKGFEVFKYLLTKVESVDENVLENAIKEDNKESVQILLEKHFSVDFCFKNGRTLIEVAAENVSPKTICFCKDEFKKYHEQGGDVNKQDKYGKTLLIKFTEGLRRDRYDGDFDDVKFLVENGVDVDIRDILSDTALYYAATEKTKDIFLYLLEISKSVQEDALFQAIVRKVLTKVEELPQDFNSDNILNMKEKLFKCASDCKENYIRDFLYNLEGEQT